MTAYFRATLAGRDVEMEMRLDPQYGDDSLDQVMSMASLNGIDWLSVEVAIGYAGAWESRRINLSHFAMLAPVAEPDW